MISHEEVREKKLISFSSKETFPSQIRNFWETSLNILGEQKSRGSPQPEETARLEALNGKGKGRGIRQTLYWWNGLKGERQEGKPEGWEGCSLTRPQLSIDYEE